MLEIILAILTKGFAFCTLYMDFGQEVEQRSADSDAPAIDLSTINLTAKTFLGSADSDARANLGHCHSPPINSSHSLSQLLLYT